jgi:ParB-like chromosome segregation protein Spo0J
MQPHGGGYTAAERAAALLEAERTLVPPKADENTTLFLRPDEIETRPSLFQQREVAFGQKRETDKDYVEKLKKRVKLVGELDPIPVVKLGNAWVVIDGHHRRTAYKELEWQEPVKCTWFTGTAREAMDASMGENKKLHYEPPWQDRHEGAWQRVLIGGWKRDQIRATCAVGPGLITAMRKALELYQNKRGAKAKKFREALARGYSADIRKCSWAAVKDALGDAEGPTRRTREEQAQALAMLLRDRLPLLKKEDPEIIAMALQRYDRKLPAKLMATRAWREEREVDFEYVEEAEREARLAEEYRQTDLL